MIEAVIAIAAFAAGAAVAGAIVHFRAKSQTAAALARVAEMNNQDVIRGSEMERLRETLAGVQQARTVAETQLAASQASLDEQKARLDEAVARLTETFKSLSQDVLRSNSQEFLDRAKDSLGKVLADTKGEMGGLVTPLRDALARYEAQIQSIEAKRVEAYSGLATNLAAMSNASASLQQQTTKLEQALRAPGIRGRWGELMLEKVLELSGLSKPIIDLQKTIATEDGTLRPDVVVNLPDNRSIIVDSKAPMNAYLDAMAAETLDVRNQKLAEHAAAVRGHMRKLAQKDYAKQVETSSDMVVMFLPGESVLAAALETDKDLLKDSIEYRVALATPTTLMLALQTVAQTWRQHKLEENAEEIARVGNQLYERLCTFAGHLKDIKEGIDKAAKSYAKVVASWQERVEPGARKLKDLGVAKDGKEIPELDASEPSMPPPPAEGGEKPAL